MIKDVKEDKNLALNFLVLSETVHNKTRIKTFRRGFKSPNYRN